MSDNNEYQTRKSAMLGLIEENQHDTLKSLVETIHKPCPEGQGEVRLTTPLNTQPFIKDKDPENVYCLIDGRPVTTKVLEDMSVPGDLLRVDLKEDSVTMELIKCFGRSNYAIVGDPTGLIENLRTQLKPKEVHFYQGNHETDLITISEQIEIEDSFMVEVFGGRINISLLDGEKQPKLNPHMQSDAFVCLKSLWLGTIKDIDGAKPDFSIRRVNLQRDGGPQYLSRQVIRQPHIEFYTRIVEGFMNETRVNQLYQLAENLECYIGNIKCEIEEVDDFVRPNDILLFQIFSDKVRLVVNRAVGVFQHPIKDNTERTKLVILKQAKSMLTNSTFGAHGTPYTLSTPKTYLGPKAVSSSEFISYLNKDDRLVSHSLGVSSAISCDRADKEDYSDSKLFVNCTIHSSYLDGEGPTLLETEFVKEITGMLGDLDLILPNWCEENMEPIEPTIKGVKLKQSRKEISPLMKRMMKRL
ncbi:hypothetical protein HWC35_gp073 [Vibrio phage USC-1]|uniref:Uncharacterized protein n=2 Tax=Aphroditevirus USC1 TaxID=2846605 RepID=A0A514A2F2_9CAUD|nr:hypothetical protein HWC35_gp073 [Vibrio phage USC-1]QCW23261.1 hypothetical protein [Vibrio phage 5 TSL-2019]QDH47467.1 hypothetical protein [Vibrio phage USC-1]